jgi:hypothetical protein
VLRHLSSGYYLGDVAFYGERRGRGNKGRDSSRGQSSIRTNEKILYQTKQKGSKFKPDLKKRMYPNMLFVTDRRILYFQPRGLIRGALGMQDYTDYPYDGMRNIEIKKGTFRSTLLIYRKSRLQDGKNPFISDIDNKEAQDIYGIVRQILERKETTMASPAPIAVSTPQTETASPIE